MHFLCCVKHTELVYIQSIVYIGIIFYVSNHTIC